MSLKRVLLHEYLMSGLLIQLAVRLAVTGNINGWFFVYILMLCVYGALVYTGIRTMSPLLNRVRLFCNLAVMFVAFSSIRFFVPAIGMDIRDSVDLICGALLSTASYFVCVRLSGRFNCKEQTNDFRKTYC